LIFHWKPLETIGNQGKLIEFPLRA
jgi:hypothetical protein